ncbi:hypothetical protein [Kalamiella sp. sgz302252]|uniref:hypothetical protein n=1 Tax=Pantoea sp. sgz302252 TaxID=3341827 RepID=UPI0036D3241D
MKSESLFNRLICVDALLSFNGVIPSLPEFQLKLVTLIELFSKLLISEGEDELLCDRLCHLLCRHLDRHIALSLSTENICWARYSLTQHFYGYEEAREEISVELAQLLEIATGRLYACASKLHKLISVSKKTDAFAALPEVAGEKEVPVAEVKIASLRPVPFPLWATIVALTGVLAVLWFICLCYLKSFDL